MKKIALIVVCSVWVAALSPLIAGGAGDTPETRRRQAERYLQATPPKAMFADLAEKMATTLPAADREKFKQLLTSALDVEALTQAMTDAMVKTFTTEELKALADFYGSPVGKSAMSKFGMYMAEVMPIVQAEMVKAKAKADQSAPSK